MFIFFLQGVNRRCSIVISNSQCIFVSTDRTEILQIPVGAHRFRPNRGRRCLNANFMYGGLW